MDTCNNMDEFRELCCMKKPIPKRFYTIWLHLWNILEMTKIIEMENRSVVPEFKGGGLQGRELCVAIKEQHKESL